MAFALPDIRPVPPPPRPPDTPCTTPVTSCKQQHKPGFNPPICLFSVFIKEVENERKRLGEGDGMTKSVTCLFNFSAPPLPSSPPHTSPGDTGFKVSYKYLLILLTGYKLFSGEHQPHKPVSAPSWSQTPSAPPRRLRSHMDSIANRSLPAPPIFPKFKMSWRVKKAKGVSEV